MAVGEELLVVVNTFQGGCGNNSLSSRHHGFSSLWEPEVPPFSSASLRDKELHSLLYECGALRRERVEGLEFYPPENTHRLQEEPES